MTEADWPNEGTAIAVAPNGGRRTKMDHPAIPIGPEDLARTAAECAEAGAAMIHIHVRDADSRHLLDAEAYRAATRAIRDAIGDRLVVQMTTEALGLYAPEAQMTVVKEVRPEAASLALREFLPNEAAEPAFAAFLAWMANERIAPQFILYSPEEAVRLSALMKRGLIPWNDPPVLFVLGRYTAGQTSAPADLLPFLAPEMPRFRHWSVCAFGRHEAACVAAGALLGGHIRVGFENNLFLPDGSTAASNVALVTAAADIVTAAGLTLASAADLRRSWAI